MHRSVLGDLGVISSTVHCLWTIAGDKNPDDVMNILWGQEMVHGSVKVSNSVTSPIPKIHAGPRVGLVCVVQS